jgi:hypothetical protein
LPLCPTLRLYRIAFALSVRATASRHSAILRARVAPFIAAVKRRSSAQRCAKASGSG